MNMDKDQELRNRISASDPASLQELPEYLVSQAAQKKRQPGWSFRSARLAVGAGSFAALALVAGITLPSAFAPQPLFTLAGGSGNTVASAESAPMVADAKVGMIWPGYVTYNYLTENLSDEAGRGHIYQAQLIGDPKEILNQLMKTFGVQGEIVRDEWATDQFPSYSVQSKDGSVETYLSIYWSGTGSWNFSRWDSSLWACTETSGTSDGSDSSSSEDSTLEAPTCNQPEPTPELIPSEAQMRQEAAALFASFGMAVSEASFKTYRDDWGSNAYAELELEGMAVPVSVSVGWDLRGELSYASGHSFKLVDRGEFNTVSALDAVARIKEGNWYGSPSSAFYDDRLYSATARDGVAVSSEPAIAETSEPAVEPTEEPIAIDEPAPGEVENVEPKVVDLTINKAEVAMLGVWDANGGFWLVPGYILHNDQGWFDSIISVIDGVIELPKYDDLMIEPMPATKEG